MLKRINAGMTIAAVGIMSVMLFVSLTATGQTQSLGPKDTFRAAGLSPKEVQDITKEVEQSAYDSADDWTSELRVKRVDLGSSAGIIVQGTKLLCGGTGNCQTWVFRRLNDKSVSLFKQDGVPVAESFRLGPGSSHGIKDFMAVANSSAESTQTVQYKFDGNLYQTK
jgi:hypothetical protein